MNWCKSILNTCKNRLFWMRDATWHSPQAQKKSNVNWSQWNLILNGFSFCFVFASSHRVFFSLSYLFKCELQSINESNEMTWHQLNDDDERFHNYWIFFFFSFVRDWTLFAWVIDVVFQTVFNIISFFLLFYHLHFVQSQMKQKTFYKFSDFRNRTSKKSM